MSRCAFVRKLEQAKNKKIHHSLDGVKSWSMMIQFLLFVIAVLLVSIFWELTKINKRLKTLLTQEKQNHDWARKGAA